MRPRDHLAGGIPAVAPRLENMKLRGRQAAGRVFFVYSGANFVFLRRCFQQVGKLLQTEIRKQGICRGTDARSAETAGLFSLVCEITHIILFSKLMPI